MNDDQMKLNLPQKYIKTLIRDSKKSNRAQKMNLALLGDSENLKSFRGSQPIEIKPMAIPINDGMNSVYTA